MKTKYSIIGAILIMFILTSCGMAPTGNVVADTPEKTETNIKIGVLLALSGSAASLGEEMREAFEMANERIKKEKNMTLALIYEDTKADTKATVDATQKLINIDEVPIIIGPLKSGGTLAIAPITESKGILLFSPTASSYKITNAGDFVFRLRETSTLHGKEMAEFLYNEGHRKAATIHAQSENSISYTLGFMNNFEKLGGAIVHEAEYDPEITDFRTFITKLKQESPDVIYITPSVITDGAIFVKQLRELGYKGTVAGSATLAMTDDYFDITMGFSEDVFVTSPLLDKNTPEASSYFEKIEKITGKPGSPYGANAYDVLMLLSDAILECDVKNTCIRDYIYNTKNYRGASGTFSFDENGDVIRPLSIKISTETEWVDYQMESSRT
jgi:branched-chain amino acid transport system substrate-binding protein